MSKLLSTMFRVSPAAIWLAILSAIASPAAAATEHLDPKVTSSHNLAAQTLPDTNSLEIQSNAPTTNAATLERVKQAAEALEVKPTDWAYQTLLALSNKYECGNLPTSDRAMSREEFATSLNTCLESMEELVALDRRKRRRVIRNKRRPVAKPRVVTPPPVAPEPLPPETLPVAPPPPENTVSQQDLEELKQLTQAFKTELQGLDARLQALEAKTNELKDKSFSTTSKLKGEVIFALTGLAGGPATATRNTIFTDRVRLNFVTSFTGKDELYTRLQSRNSTSFAGAFSGTNMTRLGFEGGSDNSTSLHRLQYRFPFSPETKVFIAATGAEFNDQVYTFNPEHQAAALGSITRFGRFNPLYRLSGEGASLTVDHKFDNNLGLVLGYAVPQIGGTDTVNNPAPNSGLFSGSNVFFSQLALKPSDDVNFGLIYARSYHSTGAGVSGNNGSVFANNPFGAGTRASANHYSLLASVNLSKDLILSGWGGLTQANQEGGAGSADIWNYALTLAAKDFGAPGNTLGFVVGVPPKVTSNTNATRRDNDTSLHLEAFYKYKLSDNIYITPGLLMLTNPEHNAANPTEYLGTVRTTFNF